MSNKSEYVKEWRKNTKLKVIACMGRILSNLFLQ